MRVAVKPPATMMNSEPLPSWYVSPGPPRKTNPLKAAEVVARPVVHSPMFCPAIQKSLAVRVRRADHSPTSSTTTR